MKVVSLGLLSALLLVALVSATPANEQFSEDGNAKMLIQYPLPRVIQNTGLQSHFAHTFEATGKPFQWDMITCPLPSRDTLPAQSLLGLQHVPVFSEIGNPQTPDFVDMSEGCIRFTFNATLGERFRIGQQSTVVEIQNGTASFTVTPENEFCDGLYCESEIIIHNAENQTIQFPFMDLWADMSIAHNISTIVSGTEYDRSSNTTITINAQTNQTFTIDTLLEFYGQQIKYNVTLNYEGINYLLDPFFISSAPSSDINIIPFQQQSIFVTWVDQSNSSIWVAGRNLTGDTFVTPILLEQGVANYSRTSIDWVNETAFVVVWTNGTIGAPSNVKATVISVEGTILSPTTTIYENLGTFIDVDVAGFDDTIAFCFTGDITDDMDIEFYDHALNELINEAGNEVDTSADPSFELNNLLNCAAVGDDVGYIWFDGQATNNVKYTILNKSANKLFSDVNLDSAVGNTAQVTATDVNSDVLGMMWYDSTTNDYEIAMVNTTNNALINLTIDEIIPSGAARVTISAFRNSTIDTFYKAVGFAHNSTHLRGGARDRSFNIVFQGIEIAEVSRIDLISIASYDIGSGNGICANHFTTGFVSDNGSTTIKSFNADGSEWNGICISECPEIWERIPQPCTNLQEFIIYNDTADCGTTSLLPSDNGTFGSCSVFDCQYNPTPPFKRKFEWLCQFPEGEIMPNTQNCVSTINQGDVFIQHQPRRKVIEAFGTVDSFQESNGLVNVYFTSENLRRNQTYNFSVTCHDTTSNLESGTFIRQVNPVDISPVWFVADRTLWSMKNAGYILGGILFSLLIVLLSKWWGTKRKK